MKKEPLARTNPFLKEQASVMSRVRSLASSTAIETGKSVEVIEQRIIHLRSSKHRVKLA